MTGTYENQGVRFLYPENWTVADEDLSGIPWSVSVGKAGGAFWSVHVYPPGQPGDALAREALEAMQAEYEGLEWREFTEEWERGPVRGYDLDFYCLDLVITARILVVEDVTHTFVMLWQAENRDFDELLDVFRAISISLRQEE